MLRKRPKQRAPFSWSLDCFRFQILTVTAKNFHSFEMFCLQIGYINLATTTLCSIYLIFTPSSPQIQFTNFTSSSHSNLFPFFLNVFNPLSLQPFPLLVARSLSCLLNKYGSNANPIARLITPQHHAVALSGSIGSRSGPSRLIVL
jgi:hypothetical protein